jgi:hypothetical protein
MSNYRGPSVTAQGERDGFLMTSAALKHSFMDDKLSLTLNGRGLFQETNFEMTSSGPGFETYRFMEREAPIFNFSISYTINNYERERRRGGQSQEPQGEGMPMY